MNAETLFLLAAIAAVLTLGRDFLRGVVEKRRKVMKANQEELMAPLKVHGIVLDETEKALMLQQTLLVQGRADLVAEQKRRIEAESERDVLKGKVSQLEERQTELLIQLGRFYGQSGSPGSGRGV